VSGFTMGLTGYRLSPQGNELWSGGAYGPEASAVTTAIVIVLFFALYRAPLRTQTLALLPGSNHDLEAGIEQTDSMKQESP
jgi:hypothetical protein